VAELEKKGFQCDGGEAEPFEMLEEQFREECNSMTSKVYDGVVVGWDLRFSFRKLLSVSTILASHPHCFFYATNEDPYDKIHGHLIPATGAILQSLHFMAALSAPARNYGAAFFKQGSCPWETES